MTEPNEIAHALEAIARILDAMSVPWAIGGSVASATYGDPRATNDIDIIAALDERKAREVVANLGAAFE